MNRLHLNTLSLAQLQDLATDYNLIGPNVFSRVDPDSRKQLIDALEEYLNPPTFESQGLDIYSKELDKDLIHAVKNHDYNTVRVLIDAGLVSPMISSEYDEDTDSLYIKETPLYLSLVTLGDLNAEEKKNAIKIFDLLLDAAIDNFDLLQYPAVLDGLLFIAIRYDNVPMAQHLLYHGADPDIGLHVAYSRGYEDMERLLLENGADVGLLEY